MELTNVIATRPTKTVYRDGDRCIKLFNENFSKADILNEALNQARVEETALNVPHVIEVTSIDGKWALVSDYIEGKTLHELMEAEPQKTDEYLDFFVDLQMKTHEQTCPLLNKHRDKMSRKIDESDLDETTQYDLQTKLASLPVRTQLCHGDFNPSNIVLTEDNVPYIIDWSHATQGNASADAARTYLLFILGGQFGLAEKYLNLYCEKSKTPKPNVQSWMPIVAASQSVKGKPEERELLLRWASVVEY